jgi:hypothetical protein
MLTMTLTTAKSSHFCFCHDNYLNANNRWLTCSIKFYSVIIFKHLLEHPLRVKNVGKETMGEDRNKMKSNK